MAARKTQFDPWELLWRYVGRLHRGILRSRAANVNSEHLRAQTRETVQTYFRQARPELQRLGLGESHFAELDESMQYLLRLSSGHNSKASYLRTLKLLRGLRPKLEAVKELVWGWDNTTSYGVLSVKTRNSDSEYPRPNGTLCRTIVQTGTTGFRKCRTYFISWDSS